MQLNTLYYCDNLEITQNNIKDESVELVYLDPPFNSIVNNYVFFTQKDGPNLAPEFRFLMTHGGGRKHFLPLCARHGLQ